MTDRDDVSARTREALAAAASRAYQAAQGNPLPEPATGMRWRIAPRVAVTACAVIAIVVAAAVFAARPRSAEDVSLPLTGPSTTSSAPGDVGRPSDAGLSSGVVTVDVEGAVASPGVYELDAGSRVADAIEAAGGALAGAELSAVNQARVLVDGEQVYLPLAGEQAAQGGPVNVNRATAKELEQLPGIGPVLAQRIVDYRDQHGPFLQLDSLMDVPGVGQALVTGIGDAATV